MDLSKLTNEELLKIVNLEKKPAREVSKQTCPDSIGKSVVKVHDLAPILEKKYPNDYPIEEALEISKEDLKKLNLKCKPPIKDKIEIEKWIEDNSLKQLKALENNFTPEPYLEEYNLDYQWNSMVNIISSTSSKPRPGRSLHFLCKDKNYNFVYGLLSFNSPMLNSKINNYLKTNYELPKVDFSYLNKYLIDVSVCIGTGPLTKYLSGKLLILSAISQETKILWDNKYKTNIKYIMTTSLYGESSIYNRVKNFNFLGLSEGWNVLFTKDELNWIKEEHKKLYPQYQISITAKAPHMFKLWNQVWRKYHDNMPMFPYKTPRGTYIFDSNKFPWDAININIEYWKTRWYLPRKERIDKGEVL